jgi:HD-like signal output (HDOD) protein
VAVTNSIPSLDEAIDLYGELSVNPEILPKLRKVINDENSILIDISTLLKVDPSLTAQIVRLSNSTYYGASEPVKSLDEAIGRLGFNQVYEAVNVQIAKDMLQHGLEPYGIGPGDLLKSSMTKAFIMECLATELGMERDVAYTVGLMSEVGKLLVAKCLVEARQESVGQKGGLIPERERAVLGFDFAEAGSRLLERWTFPEEVFEPIQYQLKPSEPGVKHKEITALAFIGTHAIDKIWRANIDDLGLWEQELKMVKRFGKSEERFIEAILASRKKLQTMSDILEALS